MEFDVFDKLSELETKIIIQKEELSRKDSLIEEMQKELEAKMKENAALRKSQSSDLVETAEFGVQTDDAVLASEKKVAESAFEGTEASIADIIKETSEAVTQNNGYVFDHETGLYFDKNSGYYYDPENQLFFEPQSGVYYSYNTETQEYSYHSRVSTELSGKFKALVERAAAQPKPSDDPQKSDDRRRRRSRSSSSASIDRYRHCRSSRRRRRHSSRQRSSRRHRRRCYSSSSRSRSSSLRRSRRRSRDYFSSSSNDRHRSRHGSPRKSRDEALVKPNEACIAATAVVYPPSLRLTVLASNSMGLAVGSVGVITSKEASSGWGCLGRNFHYCPVFDLSQDTDLEEIHCEIVFNKSEESYFVRDNKSKNGTFLNGDKLEIGDRKKLIHGDVLRIGANRFLIHIHSGQETCGQCDPSEVQAAIKSVAEEVASVNPQLAQPSTSEQQATINVTKHRRSGKTRNRRAGRQQQQAVVMANVTQYEDRAAKRRALEKATALAMTTQPSGSAGVVSSASVFTPIEETNVGARLLGKMGWKKGEGLGREKGGIAEPISASMRVDARAGLGFGNTGFGGIVNAVPIDSTPSELRYARTMSVTRERYRMIEERERLNPS